MSTVTVAGGAGKWSYDTGLFTPLARPVADSRLALLTSSGHFVDGDDPEPFGTKNMTQDEAIRRIMEFVEAPPELSEIPSDCPSTSLRVRHGGYDIRAAVSDSNTVFPLVRLRELAFGGFIGELAPNFYSFVGACSQLQLIKNCAPEWLARFKQEGVDALLLVPV